MTTPLVHEIPFEDPLKIYAQFASRPWALWIDSASQQDLLGRYSYIALDPFFTLTSKNGKIFYPSQDEGSSHHPFISLKSCLDEYSFITHPDLPPFQGGVMGYLGYDLYQHLENIPLHRLDDMRFPDMALGFYDLVIAFDHQKQRSFIFSSGYPQKVAGLRKDRAQRRINELLTA